MAYTQLDTPHMQEEIFRLLKEMRETQVSDGLTIATLKANQEHQKEDLTEIKSRITSIEKLDQEQNASLYEHMRRTDVNEAAIEILKTQYQTTVEDYKEVSKEVTTAVTKLETPGLGKMFKDNIKWIVGIVTTLAASAAGIGALLQLF